MDVSTGQCRWDTHRHSRSGMRRRAQERSSEAHRFWDWISSTCGDQMGPASDRILPAEGRQAVDSSFEKAKSRFDMLRESPTADAHWALWVDYVGEPAQTFFSLHRTSKRDDAQKRLSALRRKLVSEQALRREQMGKFWETYGHLGDYSEQHLHARHRVMSLNWQLRRWTRQSAAARKTSLESDLHRALRNGRSHEVHRLTQLLGGSGIAVPKRLFFHLPGSCSGPRYYQHEETLRFVKQAPDDINWTIDQAEFDDLLALKKDSASGPDGIPYGVYRCAGGLGSKFLFRAYQAVLEGSNIPDCFAESRTVFIPKTSDTDDLGRIIRSPYALRPLTLCICDCKLFTSALCRGLHWYTMQCIHPSQRCIFSRQMTDNIFVWPTSRVLLKTQVSF